MELEQEQESTQLLFDFYSEARTVWWEALSFKIVDGVRFFEIKITTKNNEVFISYFSEKSESFADIIMLGESLESPFEILHSSDEKVTLH